MGIAKLRVLPSNNELAKLKKLFNAICGKEKSYKVLYYSWKIVDETTWSKRSYNLNNVEYVEYPYCYVEFEASKRGEDDFYKYRSVGFDFVKKRIEAMGGYRTDQIPKNLIRELKRNGYADWKIGSWRDD